MLLPAVCLFVCKMLHMANLFPKERKQIFIQSITEFNQKRATTRLEKENNCYLFSLDIGM